MATIGTTKMGLSISLRPEDEIKADALREAADLIYSDDGPGNPLSVATWLRQRADRLAGRHPSPLVEE